MKYIKVIRKRKEQIYTYAFFIGRNTILRQKESHPFHKFCSFLFLLHAYLWDSLGRIFFVSHNNLPLDLCFGYPQPPIPELVVIVYE